MRKHKIARHEPALERLCSKVYLAGPITGLTFDESEDWRREMQAAFSEIGVAAVSPLRGKNYLKDVGKISGGQDYPHPMSTDKGVINRDAHDVRTSDLVIANVLGAEVASPGTCVEIGIALEAKVPTIVVMEADGSNPHDRHMIRGAVGWVVHDLDDAFKIAATVLGFDIDFIEETDNGSKWQVGTTVRVKKDATLGTGGPVSSYAGQPGKILRVGESGTWDYWVQFNPEDPSGAGFYAGELEVVDE